MSIKIAVGGCRTFSDREYIFRCLDEYLLRLKKKSEIVFISGHCKGVDSIAEKYAAENNYQVVRFDADWKKYGKAAGPIRNKEMVEAADVVIAFWDGISKGTKSLIACAKKSGKDVTVFTI